MTQKVTKRRKMHWQKRNQLWLLLKLRMQKKCRPRVLIVPPEVPKMLVALNN